MCGKACQRTPAVGVEGCSFCRIVGPKRRSRPGRTMGHVTALGPDFAAGGGDPAVTAGMTWGVPALSGHPSPATAG